MTKRVLSFLVFVLLTSMTANAQVLKLSDVDVDPICDAAVEKSLQQNLVYPANAKKSFKEGKVEVSFIVNANGTTSGYKIVKSDNTMFNVAVLNALRKMPRWTPAKKNGKAVSVENTMTFFFFVQPVQVNFQDKTTQTKWIGKTNVSVRKTELTSEMFWYDVIAFYFYDDPYYTDDTEVLKEEEAAVGSLDFYPDDIINEKLTVIKKEEIPDVPDNTVFSVVEQMASFPGGPNALNDFIARTMKYPPLAEENGIKGRVVCQFIVEKDGSITDVKVVKGVDPTLDREAVRIIKAMPKWNPGKQNGKPVRVRYTLPLVFNLN